MSIRRKTSNHPAIERLRLLAMFMRQNRVFVAAEVAARYEVSRKTIVRDLDFLRYRLGFEVIYDRRQRRYTLLSAPPPVL